MNYLSIFLILLFTACGNKTEIHILFENVNGLQIGDPVSIDGFEISNIDNMTLENGLVDVQFKVENEIHFYSDATFTIRGNLLGDKFLDIDPGTSNKLLDLTHPIQGNLEPTMIDSATIHDLVEKVNDYFDMQKSESDSIEIK